MDLLFSPFWPVIDSTVTLNTSSSQLLWNTQRERISKKTLILPRLRSLSLSKNNNSLPPFLFNCCSTTVQNVCLVGFISCDEIISPPSTLIVEAKLSNKVPLFWFHIVREKRTPFSPFWPVIDSTVTLNTSSSQLLWNTRRERISKKHAFFGR